jgi:3-phenylpropionate/trans-cinnamate dioxygenase ferredoxin reductase subunit
MRQTVAIVGGGQAGFQLAASLRDLRYEGRIVLIGDEPHAPYRRPPLSKGYLLGEADESQVLLCTPQFQTQREVELRTGTQVTAIDRAQQTLQLSDASTLSYDHLVLATGTRNRKLSVPGADLDNVHYLRDRSEADRLRAALTEARKLVVIGGGFIGLELAACAAKQGLEVVVLELATRPMARAVSHNISTIFEREHARMGVQIRCGVGVARLLGEAGRVRAVETTDGQTLAADLVVVGIGVVPNAELAAACGLSVADGVVVDELLQTSDRRVSAIGDVAAHPNRHAAGKHVRIESVQNACDQARCVAQRLVGKPQPYTALPWFWTHQGSLKLQLAGLPVPGAQAVVRGDPAGTECSVFLFHAGNLVCVESLNRPGEHMLARRLLDQRVALTPAQAADSQLDLKSLLAQPAARPASP